MSDAAPDRHILERLRVLVVDDEPDVRELVVVLLEQYGAISSEASSARDALEKLAAGEFDVLVSDIGMPLEDGYVLVREIRSLGDGRVCNIPALALTAYTRAEDRRRALEAGFQMHVGKPVEPRHLVNAVAQLAGRIT